MIRAGVREWWHRYGWDPRGAGDAREPGDLRAQECEIHDVYDIKRWWWEATDGIRETTWPGVSTADRGCRGALDYFVLP